MTEDTNSTPLNADITVGERVYDSEEGPGKALIVIDCPSESCEEHRVPNTDKTVAEFNEEYPADADVCVVIFESNFEEQVMNAEELSPDELQETVEDEGIRKYAYPKPRLTPYEQEFSKVPEAVRTYYDLICYQHARLIHLAADVDNYAFLWTKYERLVDGEIEMTSITKENKYLLQEDFGICTYCGHKADTQYDHVIPISKGGPADISNQVPACEDCNSDRGDMDIIDWHRKRGEPVPRVVWGKYLKLYRDRLWEEGKLHAKLPEQERERWNGVNITRNITRRVRSSHIKRDEAGRQSDSKKRNEDASGSESTEQKSLDQWS